MPEKVKTNLSGSHEQIEVDVTQRDIDAAKQHGGNPIFTLIDVTAAKDDIPQYRLGTINN
jgi:hypothetical protein